MGFAREQSIYGCIESCMGAPIALESFLLCVINSCFFGCEEICKTSFPSLKNELKKQRLFSSFPCAASWASYWAGLEMPYILEADCFNSDI